LINKVNRPTLSLVPKPKATENDPGSSQGSGLLYDGGGPNHPEPKRDQAPDRDQKEDEPKEGPELAVVASVEQAGMTEVIKDLLEKKKDSAPASAGLTTHRYSSDSGVAKGLLLNRKAE
jgi:hypothetical protein